jgi:hypothetical protein
MRNLVLLPAQLQKAFRPGARGVVGVVDELLELCRDEGLQFDWQASQCRARPLGADAAESTEVPLPKSAFRAVLARMAALCNEWAPGSVSPYGGEGELLIGTDSPAVFRVAFTNTPDEQRLEVRCVGDDKDEESSRGSA